MSRSNIIKILINTLLGVALVFIWLQFVDISSIFQSLKTANIWFFAPMTLAFLATTLFRASRLKILLKTYKIPLLRLTYLTFIGQFLSFVIPIRAGEIAKSVYLHTHYDIPLARVVVWILLDRFFDFWTVLLLVTLLYPIVDVNLPFSIYLIFAAAFLIFTLCASGIIFAHRQTKSFLKFFRIFLPFKKLQNFYLKLVEKVTSEFSLLKTNLRNFPQLLILSVLSLISDAVILWCGFAALQTFIKPLQIFYGSIISMLTFLIPSAPGYIGSAEGLGSAVFAGILGLGVNLASAGVLFTHVFTILAIPAFGIIGLYSLKFNLKLVWDKLKKKK